MSNLTSFCTAKETKRAGRMGEHICFSDKGFIQKQESLYMGQKAFTDILKNITNGQEIFGKKKTYTHI